jgi:Fe-Mn family superoxide dismutase
MSDPSRRDFLQSSAMATLLAATAAPTLLNAADAARPAASAGAFDFETRVAPLPFAAKALNGISEKLIQSHWENNYTGAVKALNVVRGKLLQAANDANTPAYVYTGLKREQLFRTGSVVLHEHYFGNLGGNGKADGAIRSRIAAAFGTFDAWENEFRKIGTGLGGGSGWVVLGYNRHLKLLENYWMADHATGPVDVTPVLVMDMYEHAYQMDFGAAAAKYIDAFFANINWETVASRV